MGEEHIIVVNTWINVVYMWPLLVYLKEVPCCYGHRLGTSRCIRGLYRMWMVCALVCRELELTVWVMWRPCEEDVRYHPDVRDLNAALCGAFYSEQWCGCAVPRSWVECDKGRPSCVVKWKDQCWCDVFFGVDVWNFQEVMLINAVVF